MREHADGNYEAQPIKNKRDTGGSQRWTNQARRHSIPEPDHGRRHMQPNGVTYTSWLLMATLIRFQLTNQWGLNIHWCFKNGGTTTHMNYRKWQNGDLNHIFKWSVGRKYNPKFQTFFLDPSTDPQFIKLSQLYGRAPVLGPLFQLSRAWIWAAHRARMRLLGLEQYLVWPLVFPRYVCVYVVIVPIVLIVHVFSTVLW